MSKLKHRIAGGHFSGASAQNKRPELAAREMAGLGAQIGGNGPLGVLVVRQVPDNSQTWAVMFGQVSIYPPEM